MINSAIVHVWFPMEPTGFNGFIEHAKAKLYKSGTSGHVALELCFEKNEKNSALVKSYINSTGIPCEENEKYYSVYWSFYSGLLTNTPFYFGSFQGDCLDSYFHRNQIWSEQSKEIFQPKEEVITPNLLRFIQSVPYLRSLNKIPYFEKICTLLGIDKHPKPYLRTLGIREITHSTFLESRKSEIMDELVTNGATDESIALLDKIVKIQEDSKSLGRNPDHSFHFSIQSPNNKDGFILEAMLKKMSSIVCADKPFELYGLNCSETALQILSSGDNLSPSIFDKRGLFFKAANPYLVAQLCEKYNDDLNLGLLEVPLRKKIKLEDKKCNNANDDILYYPINETCPLDALSRCQSELDSSKEKIPYLPSGTISDLHELLSDKTAEFACQIHNSTDGEIELVDPKILLNSVKKRSFEKANKLNKNANHYNARNKNDPDKYTKKRKRDEI